MAKHNCKAYANIGSTRRATRRYAVLLDICAGSNFTHKDIIPSKVWNKSNPSSYINVRDANSRKGHRSETINPAVEIGDSVEMIYFIVVKRIASNVLLGCNYCERNIEDIKTLQRIVQLNDGKTITFICNLGRRNCNAAPLLEEKQFSNG